MEVRDGTPLFVAALERTSHIVAVAPQLFNLQSTDATHERFLAPETLAFVRKLVVWMAGAAGRRLEVALAQLPVFSPEFSSTLVLWHELQPHI